MPTPPDDFLLRWLRMAAAAGAMAGLLACSPLSTGNLVTANPGKPLANGGTPVDAAAARLGANAALSSASASTSPATNGNGAAAPGEVLVKLLAYADRVRSLSNAELSQEAVRLGTVYVPADQVQLALVLAQLRQTPELVRAQEVLTRLLANQNADAQALHPLARLLAARYGEQRRLEDLADKQSQQTREVQRRLDQTNERLEALKAIERSLTSRPPAAAPAPASTSSAIPAPAPAPASRARNRASAPKP